MSQKWTPAQWDAITHEQGALLVSAAAGSGKTAVLAARCVHLVCTSGTPCNVDELLVLTFTRAAAAEMRERIEKELRKHIDTTNSTHLTRQLRLIDRASITTLDSFCATLVRSNFHLLGIDPGFAILAPEDASLLKAETIDRLLDVEYDSPQADALKTVLDGYFGGDDGRLRGHIIEAHALIQSVVDPHRWIANALSRLEPGRKTGAPDDLFTQFSQMQTRALKTVLRKLAAARAFSSDQSGLAKYVGHIDELTLDAQSWLELSQAGQLDSLAKRVASYKAPTLPRVDGDLAGKEQAQNLINAAKDLLKPKGEAHTLCRWSHTELSKGLAVTFPYARYLLDLTSRFTSAYDRAKRDLRVLDFSDIERLALVVLRDNSDSLRPSDSARALHGRFQHVLVDEFQDINPLQNAILRLASRDLAAEVDESVRSNFFTVGDVKQSIYRFRLAEPQQFIDRQASLRAQSGLGRVIDLQENFRSRGPLLEAVNDVFRLLMTAESSGIEYDKSHELRSALPYPELGPKGFVGKPIELHLLPKEVEQEAGDDDEAIESFDREIALVAERVRALIAERRVVLVKQGAEQVSREIRFGDIAVLLRSARFKASVVADGLRAAGIPVYAEDSTGYFTNTEVQDVLSILRLISNAKQDVPMAAFLRSPIAGIAEPEDALARIRLTYPDEPFHRAVVLYAQSSRDALAEILERQLQRLALWREMFGQQSIAESLSTLLDETEYLVFCRALPDGAQRVANLQELIERAGAFDSFERQGLDRFLKFLDELEAEDQLGRPSVVHADIDFVRVMTVHKSKGLEFPVVIVPDLGKRFNERSLSSPVLLDRDLGLALSVADLTARVRYPSLSSLVFKSHLRRQGIAEEIRVLYVALTRAREHLILIGTSKSTYSEMQSEWATLEGALPDEAILGARTALDWIGPIAAMTEHRGLGTFAVTDWHEKSLTFSSVAKSSEPAQKKISRWLTESRKSSSDLSESAQAVADRLRFLYAHHPATLEAVTASISDQASMRSDAGAAGRAIELRWPAAYRPERRADAIEVGSATHRFLEGFDPTRASGPEGLAVQAQELVARLLMTEREAGLVKLDIVEWFLSTDLGQMCRDKRNRLLREQSITVGTHVDGLDPSDCRLVRGRIDALLDTPDGLILIDYKTDRVEPLFVQARAASYLPQLRGYANALQCVVGRPILRAALVFLNARQIIDLPADALASNG